MSRVARLSSESVGRNAAAMRAGSAVDARVDPWANRALVVVIGATIARLFIAATIPLANGETYYYVWSRFPSLSYYDHPPLVAWMTWLTTQLSHGSLAVRVAPVVCSATFGAFVYRIGERLFSARAGFFALLIVTSIPAFIVSSYTLNPECALAPLWALSLLKLIDLRDHDEPWRPLVLGVCIGAAFLSKYTGVLLVGVSLAYVAASPDVRRWLKRPSFYLGGVAALAMTLPVIVWNAERDWPSIMLHLVERNAVVDAPTLGRNAQSVLMGQWSAFHPLGFPALVLAMVAAIRRRRDERYRILALASWPVLLFLFLAMVRVRDSEDHWTMVGYIAVAVAAGGWLDEASAKTARPFRALLAACVGMSALATGATYVYAKTPSIARFIPGYDPTKDVFNEMTGWDEVDAAVEAQTSNLGSKAVVASCQYALCAHLLTATEDRPPVYCPTERRTEFDFLDRRAPPEDAPVVYVTDDHYHDAASNVLPGRDCKEVEVVSVVRGGRTLRHYQLSACMPHPPSEDTGRLTLH